MFQMLVVFFIVIAVLFGFAVMAVLSNRGDRTAPTPTPGQVAPHNGRYPQKPPVFQNPTPPEKVPSMEPVYAATRALLTPAERSFFGVLQSVLPGDLLLFAKVRLSDIIEPRHPVDNYSPSHRQTALNKVTSKHVDFALCDAKTTKVRCVIELDDKSHHRSDRRTRDSFVDAALQHAGIPVLRFAAARGYTPANIRAELVKAGLAAVSQTPELELASPGRPPKTTITPATEDDWAAKNVRDDSRYMPPVARA